MLLVGAVDGDAFFAVAVAAAGFQAGTVVFVFIFFAKFCGKFFLKAQTLRAVFRNSPIAVSPYFFRK